MRRTWEKSISILEFWINLDDSLPFNFGTSQIGPIILKGLQFDIQGNLVHLSIMPKLERFTLWPLFAVKIDLITSFSIDGNISAT